MERGRSWEHGFLTRWMFEWTIDADSVLGPVVHALKGGSRARAWEEIASQWAARDLGLRPITRVFVPCPSREGTRDHAFAFCEALANIWHAPVEDCLRIEGTRSSAQKRLNAQERARRVLTAKYFPILRPGEVLTFVDDVVTTGSTVRAAYAALGRPQAFEAWAMVSRPKLVEFGKF